MDAADEARAMIGIGTVGGVRIDEDPTLVLLDGEDWSRVRSPSRAARRRRQGHRQNIKQRWKPDPTAYHVRAENLFVMHPAMAAQLRQLAKEVGA
jgi:hypothetical protein